MTERERPSPSSDVFVPISEEQDYCRSHNIEYRKLNNGITLLGISREVEDRAHAQIDFILPSGSYLDPEGKSGLHHFVEHLAASEITLKALSDGIYFNAVTTPSSIGFNILEGVANPEYRNYGVWPLLPEIRVLFNNPFCFLDNIDEAIRKEKGVVLGEISETREKPEEAFRDLVFGKNNPWNANVAGTKKEVNSFTSNDVFGVAQDIFQPDEMIISSFYEGPKANSKIVVDELEKEFGNYRKANGRKKFDKSLYDKLNPKLHSGSYQNKIVSKTNNLTGINFIWEAPLKRYSPEDFSFSALSEILGQRLLEFFRRNGLGYSCNKILFDLYAKRLFTLSLNLPGIFNQEYIANSLSEEIREKIFGQLGDEEVDKFIKNQVQVIRTVPRPKRGLCTTLIEAFNLNKRIIDIDKIERNAIEGLKKEKIIALRNTLMDQKPSVVAIVS